MSYRNLNITSVMYVDGTLRHVNLYMATYHQNTLQGIVDYHLYGY